jgi:hypothetical protein
MALTVSAKTLRRAVKQAATGEPELGRETARSALALARTKKDRANAISYLVRVETSPFARYNLSRKLVELRPAQPDAWAHLYHAAKDCGFHRAAAKAKHRYAAVKKEWEVHERPRLEAEWAEIAREDPDFYARIKKRFEDARAKSGDERR